LNQFLKPLSVDYAFAKIILNLLKLAMYYFSKFFLGYAVIR